MPSVSVCMPALIQVRDGKNSMQGEIPDITALCPIAFTCKSLLNEEWHYSDIELEALNILHGLEKFLHY